MNSDWVKLLLVYALIPTILGMIKYFMKSHTDRLDTLEKQMAMKLTELEVRQILSDKLDPLKDSIEDCKDRLDKILDMLLKKN
jgi:hypothetical protein